MRRLYLEALIIALGSVLIAGCAAPPTPGPEAPPPPKRLQGPVAFMGAAYDYLKSLPLDTPPRDLHALKKPALSSGYAVRHLPDLRRSYASWRRALSLASPEHKSLFIFSGHGVFGDPLSPSRTVPRPCNGCEGCEAGQRGFSLVDEQECAVPAPWITGPLAGRRAVRMYVINTCFAGLMRLPDNGAHYLLAPGSSWISVEKSSAPVSRFVAAMRQGYDTAAADADCDNNISMGEMAAYLDVALRGARKVGRFGQLVAYRKSRPGDPVLFRGSDAWARRPECRKWTLLKERLLACVTGKQLASSPALPRWCSHVDQNLARLLRRTLQGDSPFPLKDPVWLISGSKEAAPWTGPIFRQLRGRGLATMGRPLVAGIGKDAEARWIAGMLQRFAEVFTVRLEWLVGGELVVSVADRSTGYLAFQEILPRQVGAPRLEVDPTTPGGRLRALLERGVRLPIFTLVAGEQYEDLPACGEGQQGRKHVVAHFLGRTPERVKITVRAPNGPCEVGPLAVRALGMPVPCAERMGQCIRLPLKGCACRGDIVEISHVKWKSRRVR